MNLFSIKEAGDKGAGGPFPLHPKSPPKLLRFAPEHFQLTKPNTSCTIITPASLRSDCCSPSLRNAVRLPSGIDVRLHRNTQRIGTHELLGQQGFGPGRSRPREVSKNYDYPFSFFCLAHLARAALLALALLSSGVSLAALLFPPFEPPIFPNATA